MRLSLIVILLVLVGCSARKPDSPFVGVTLTQLRGATPHLKRVEQSVPRSKYVEMLRQANLRSQIRLVETFDGPRGDQAPPPEYRIFNIRTDGPYALLGLANADMLVAAHDYVVTSPMKFFSYLEIVTAEPEARIEIRRGGQPLLLVTKFTD